MKARKTLLDQPVHCSSAWGGRAPSQTISSTPSAVKTHNTGTNVTWPGSLKVTHQDQATCNGEKPQQQEVSISKAVSSTNREAEHFLSRSLTVGLWKSLLFSKFLTATVAGKTIVRKLCMEGVTSECCTRNSEVYLSCP